MKTRALVPIAVVALFQAPILTAMDDAAAVQPRELTIPRNARQGRQLFDAGWRFHAGDVSGGEAASLDDAAWEKIDLPHDFMIEGKGQAIVQPGGRAAGTGRASTLPTEPEGPFDPRSPGGNSNGYLNGGLGWYRKTFTVPEIQRGQRVFVEFEGVYMNSEVWINGHSLGSRPYGYSTFEYELTPHLVYGRTPNVLAVKVNVQQPSTRWYSGAGIYRHVWLTTTAPVHVAQWGTTIRTPEITSARATVVVRTTVQNQSNASAPVVVETTLVNRQGGTVGQGRARATIPAGGSTDVTTSIVVSRPHRWSIDDPYLYGAATHVLVEGGPGRATQPADTVRTVFGFRTVEFTPENGLLLNGVKVPIQGVCLHHDLGALGAAAYDRGIERQLEIMKTMGVNAIRTSHNPPAPALLDFADRMGFVVMDEVFDEWKQNKTRFGYGQFFDEWSERDVRDFVRRDRNHASVIMWSIGNEIPEQGNVQNGEAMATRLASFVADEDPTRPMTAAMNNPTRALDTGFAKPLGLFGVNYNLGVYDRVRTFKSYASETSSNYSSRDEYNLVLKDGQVTIQNQLNNQCTSYDLDFPRWGNTADAQFQAMRKSPWIAGEFVWTGFDYIGEPTPFSWPNRSSSFGIVDLAGFPKDRYYLYQSQWQAKPMVHLLPHWNWPDEFRGKTIPVWAYTNADSVELFLNNRSLGVRNWTGVSELHLTWQVPYEPGTLRAVATKSGKVVANDRVETTGPPARLELVADRTTIDRGAQDLSFVTVRVLDARGRLVRSDVRRPIQFELTGGGSIAGVDDGDPTNHEPFKGPSPDRAKHNAFHGLALAIVKAGVARGGVLTLRATSDGLAPAQIRLVTNGPGARGGVGGER
ncbi:MAG TPA: glycoside hydrolase family 2 TIM barrel-domain containing protein [Vicinamibacterales bacterium]|nr:glycoside hydrolase family 2 TIM barrel-domain containing protein [Vicinamibacterales bacterium]